MTLSTRQLWDRFQKYYSEFPTLGLAVDVSRVNFAEEDLAKLQPAFSKAFASMAALESGAIANPDENRMVGHYWLRNPALAPSSDIRLQIEQMQRDIEDFVSRVHSGKVTGSNGVFKNVLVIGIGGSALGPQFVAHALGDPLHDRMQMHFLDNTDPDGFDRVLAKLGDGLRQTLCVVISKSGGTKETRNGMIEARAHYERLKAPFPAHAVAITGQGSDLDKLAEAQGWLRRFPMWDWVGGRTSETSAVGLLPAALQGIDIKSFLDGAKACDEITRKPDPMRNPSAQLAAMWYCIGHGRGLKDMVIIPYKDRLELFSRYLQQLVMESLGKEKDLSGRVVHQGIAVYGNKGSTDQHAYIQQLRDGINNFFVTFIRVLNERQGPPLMVEPSVTSGDYLAGFLFGTRKALFEKDRQSITVTIREVSPFTVGVLIALYERAVGLYASLVNINPYHQPGVEAGKKAASDVLAIQARVTEFLIGNKGKAFQVEALAEGIGQGHDSESVFHVVEHLSANPRRGIAKRAGAKPFAAEYLAV
jgi:glucose-6-phosphate isomerase